MKWLVEYNTGYSEERPDIVEPSEIIKRDALGFVVDWWKWDIDDLMNRCPDIVSAVKIK